MPLDPVAAAIVEAMDGTFPRVETFDDAAEARRRIEEMQPQQAVEPVPVARVEDRSIPGPGGDIPVRVYWPAGYSGGTLPGVVFFHGGGWVICGLDSHDGTCRAFANGVDAVVVSVDYRLAPETKYPGAVDDCLAATRWVAANAAELGIDSGRLAVAGDSAGGNLTAAVALRARDEDGPALVHQAMVYPATDVSATRNDYPSKSENATGYFLTTDSMEWYRRQYLRDDADGEHPHCSPLLAEALAGLPPAFVVTAEFDPLRDEGERYAERLVEAGVPAEVYRAPGMFHGFFGMDAMLDGAKQAQALLFESMRATLHGAAAET
jgi:acetyl esterase